jgi:hypothetical protein
MTIAAPSLFPFRHDWGQPFKVTRELKTGILVARDGSETRVQLRANPNIAMTMRCVFLTEMGAGRLLATWRGASQPLRYYAPQWCDATDLTVAVTAGDAIVQLDTTTRPLFDLSPSLGVGYAMLWRSEEFAEVVSYHELDDSLIVLDAGTVNSYAVLGTRVVPVRPMWLSLPVTVTWLAGRIATADLAFVDQKEQAGLGLDVATDPPIPATLRIYIHSGARNIAGASAGINHVGSDVFFAEAVVEDALGAPIPDADVDWSIVDNEHGAFGAYATVVPTLNSRFARVDANTASSDLMATSGAATATIGAS